MRTQAPSAQATAELWLRLGMHVRLALCPDDPRLVAQYLSVGETLVARHGRAPWQVHDRALCLLLDTAGDGALPMIWRLVCLDACCRPMSALGALVCDDAGAARLRVLARRLARFTWHPPGHELQS